MALDWTDAEELAPLLLERFPDTDPLTIRFPDLQKWVCELQNFSGTAKPASAQLLEDIQRQWYVRYCG